VRLLTAVLSNNEVKTIAVSVTGLISRPELDERDIPEDAYRAANSRPEEPTWGRLQGLSKGGYTPTRPGGHFPCPDPRRARPPQRAL
jgi:hypothetical protein